PNCRAGLKTAFAKIGAFIPEGEFKIKKGKLRGVESFGMLCSSKELGIPGGTHEGIMELPEDTKVGAFLRDVLPGDKPETVFEIEVTWNRPDALSVVGLAREYAAVLGRPFKLPEVGFVESDTDVNDEIEVEVQDSVKCPRYTARVITSVKDGPSPDFMVKRLEACGIRSLGLLVDVTNYVMLELGQPLHAFDYAKLAGRRIVVRSARSGETMKTLDGIERKLDENMLLICDAENASVLAGVMGGANSEIAADTGKVLVESALFDPATTKYTSTKLGLGTESSYRYIRGVDKDLADFASRRVVHLLQKYGDAVVAKGVVDVDGRTTHAVEGADGAYVYNEPVEIVFSRARNLIGIDIPDERMMQILDSIGLKKIASSDVSATYAIPSWRWDLQMEADLVEEIARLYGLDNIPDTMPSAQSISSLDDAPFRAQEKLRSCLTGLGFYEAMHYSFLSAAELNVFGDNPERLPLPDPVSAEYGILRDSLLPQLYQSLGRNAAHRIEEGKLFEIGRVFKKNGDAPAESSKLAMGFFGPVGRDALARVKPVAVEEALLWMKGAVERVVKFVKVGKTEFRPTEHSAFSIALEIVINGRPAGILGVVSEKLRHPFRLTTQLALAEIDLNVLLKRVDAIGKITPVPQFPAMTRDIAFVAGADVTHEAVVKAVKKASPKELTDIKLFDIFTSKELGKGRSSRAYSLTFRADDRTLTDDEVNAAFSKIVESLKANLAVEIREG
ncbi:MAG: phenylalanine--tRNA ligase subunit beta, partial [Kiritimatiellae bacterium]|nr:phenylalanine--tRNA ligase subunit beta [Kiritimatiellia bacterium]